jgi:capsular polysaccharide export protein
MRIQASRRLTEPAEPFGLRPQPSKGNPHPGFGALNLPRASLAAPAFARTAPRRVQGEPLRESYRRHRDAKAPSHPALGTNLRGPIPTAPLSFETLPRYERVLLLQGPTGPFFREFSGFLQQRGATVTKVNFNGGDDFYFSGKNVLRYRGSPERWPQFLFTLVMERRIQAIFLFGDCRPVHHPAVQLANGVGIDVWVFEEGYVRPNYITLEKGGVNGYSPLHDVSLKQILETPPVELSEPGYFPDDFRHKVFHSFVYFLFGWLWSYRYPEYDHHKPFRLCRFVPWVRSAIRHLVYRTAERPVIERILTEGRQRYFLVPLQVYDDSQVTCHSTYGGMEAFIEESMASFARHAPQDAWLVFKHHPMDRGHVHYGRLIASLARRHGCEERIFYIHDAHLPTLLKHTKGVVVINSTVGLQALHHGAPVIALGKAIYNKPPLTYGGRLDDFWKAPPPVDREAVMRFRANLIARTQINAGFHSDFLSTGTPPAAIRRR